LLRLITYSIHYQKLSIFHNVTTKSGLHIHHMVPGMLLALTTGPGAAQPASHSVLKQRPVALLRTTGLEERLGRTHRSEAMADYADGPS
jgi:hypothetical protein